MKMNAKGLLVKRRLCIVLLLAFSVAVLTLNVAYADVELIVNGGFESGDLIPGWTDVSISGAHPFVSSDDAHTGTYSLYMGRTVVGVQQTLSPAVATTSDLTFWLRNPAYPDKYDPDGGVGVGIYYSDGSESRTELVLVSADWTQYVLPVDNTKEVSKIGFGTFGLYGIYIDDVSCMRAGAVPVGGYRIRLNKLELLAPYIGLVSLIISTVAVSAVYVKHRKKHACMLGRIMESIKR